MSVILTVASRWVRWYRVLRYAKALSSSPPCAMACGWRVADAFGPQTAPRPTAHRQRKVQINAALL